MVLRKFEFGFQSEPLKQFAQLPNQVDAGFSLRSYSSLIMTSESSDSMYSESGG